MLQKLSIVTIIFALLVADQALCDADQTLLNVASGVQRTALIELYTSEGCSSCPPADRWLGSLTTKKGLWQEFVPVAFHVDYWDYIGWKDRFARADFSNRQRHFATEGKARFVYTPGFFRNGKEWRGWGPGKTPRADKDNAGVLSLVVNEDEVSVHFAAADAGHGELTAHIVTLGMGLETDVRMGENKGKTLSHDFVALGVRTIAMKRDATGYTAYGAPPEIAPNPPEQAMIAWVSQSGEQAPIQSVGGYLRRPD